MNIGVFDSGIGGMSVLNQALVSLPNENYIFYADVDHVPYGTKTKEQVIDYVDDVIKFMIEHDCKAVVIACNTATSAAAQTMRAKYDIPIIGIEPAVKPAVEQSKGKRVLVIATPLTVKEKKLQELVARVDDAHLVDLLAMPKLVTFAEKGEFDSPEVLGYIESQLSQYNLDEYSEFVLGCTHFNYFKDSYKKILPKGIHLIDGCEGTVKQLERVLKSANKIENNDNPNVTYYLSGRKVTKNEELNKFYQLHKRLDGMRKIHTT